MHVHCFYGARDSVAISANSARPHILQWSVQLDRFSTSIIWYMSQVTYGNLLTSAVIRCRFPWKPVQKFKDRLWRVCGIVFRDLQNHLSGLRRIVFWAPVDSSYGNPPNDLWETASYRVHEIVFGSPQITVQSPSNVLRQPFSGTFRRYV